jgi:hypothetical protein
LLQYSSTLSSALRGIPFGGNVWRSEFTMDHGLSQAPDPLRHAAHTPLSPNIPQAPTIRGGLSRAEGPLQGSDRGLLYRYANDGHL